MQVELLEGTLLGWGSIVDEYDNEAYATGFVETRQQIKTALAEKLGIEESKLVESNQLGLDYTFFIIEEQTRVAFVRMGVQRLAKGGEKFTICIEYGNKGSIFIMDIDRILDNPVFEYVDGTYETKRSPHFKNLFEFIEDQFPKADWESLLLLDVESALESAEMTLYG